MDVFKVKFGENHNKEKGLTSSKNCLPKETFSVIANVEDFLVNSRLPFIQSARATACRHSWGGDAAAKWHNRLSLHTENSGLSCICSKAMGAFETI